MGKRPSVFHTSLVALLLAVSGVPAQVQPGALTITRLHYGGGGDWYSDPSSIPNLIAFTRQNTGIQLAPVERRAAIGDDSFWESSYFYLTGHGNISFSNEEATLLRAHLLNGAFLHADDNYGMNEAFRREMSKVFPDKRWVELGPEHPIFYAIFPFPKGLPKIHEHDNQRPQGFALFEGQRMLVFYTYECDLGDGWEDAQVHDVPPELRIASLQMGANIITYALSQ